jgi:hypothetical protein
MMKNLSLMMVVVFVMGFGAQAVMLNYTTFDGTEPQSDGNITGYNIYGGSDSGFDTVNGWTWANVLFTGSTVGTGGIFTGLDFGALGTPSDLQLKPGTDLFHDFTPTFPKLPEDLWFDIGNASHPAVLAQAFTVNPGDDITITYGAHSGTGTPNPIAIDGTYFYIDDGSGVWTPRAYALIDTNCYARGTTPDPDTQYGWEVDSLIPDTFTFTAQGANIRIAVVGNDGTDCNTRLEFLQVDAVPEPATMALLGLGGLLLRRKK